MLAMLLAGFLLVGIYAAIDQSWRISSSGREEMERAQLARSLIHRIERDIRAITYQPPPPVEDTSSTTTSSSSTTNSSSSSSSSSGGSSSSGSSSGGSSSSSSSSTSSTDTATEPTGPNSKPIGIRGTDLQMEMSIIRPRRDLLPGTGSFPGVLGTSDLREVTYSFVAPGSSPISGLIRSEGDRMAIEVAEANGGQAAQLSSFQMLAPEVALIRFRYFDAGVWSVVWDSDTVGRLPRAVEVSVAFPPMRRKPSVFNSGVSHSMDSFRTVIMIPVSDPFPKEFVQ